MVSNGRENFDILLYWILSIYRPSINFTRKFSKYVEHYQTNMIFSIICFIFNISDTFLWLLKIKKKPKQKVIFK